MLVDMAESNYNVKTHSHHRFTKHKNIVSNIRIEELKQIWVSNITHVGTKANPTYLGLTADAYSKKITGEMPLTL
jgi:hypothetical protein